MSLGDYLRLLRAKKGGITPWDIEAATDLPKGLYRQMEQRYRAVGDDESIRTLADYYGVSFDDLRWRLDWPRKDLSRALVHVMDEKSPIALQLWNGRTLSGQVRWWDLGAIGLEGPGGNILVVQRHAVEKWEPHILEAAGQTQEDDEEDEV